MYSVVLLVALSGGAETTEFGKHGCSGCSGVSCHGCSGYSSCHGCHGGRKHSRCHGCSGCSGYVGCNGCSGCHGCHGRRHKHSRCHGCSGCYGTVYCNGGGCNGSVGCSGSVGCNGGHTAVQTTTDSVARIIVNVPAGARVTVDGTETKSTSERRVFLTPALEQGEYAYTLQAQVDRDGQTVTETRLVTVRPGQTTTATFELATQSSVASR